MKLHNIHLQLNALTSNAFIKLIYFSNSLILKFYTFGGMGKNTQLEPSFVNYLYKLTMRYNARDFKRFNEQKRYSMMVCFLFEIRKILLDYLVKMHDQFIQEMHPSLRKYFSGFINLPFAAKHGSEKLMEAIGLVRQLDTGKLKHLPDNAPTSFISRELIRSYKTKDGKVNRNAWELGLAITMKDALRSGDLYLPKSKQHVSFWELTLISTHGKIPVKLHTKTFSNHMQTK